jgi:CMP-N-acetylneuraminic acid synthetase
MKNNILIIIPARSGSKGLPNKNILHLNNKPLIHYTIEARNHKKLCKNWILRKTKFQREY